MPFPVTLTVLDSTNETSTVQLNSPDATSAANAATNIANLYQELRNAGFAQGGRRRATASTRLVINQAPLGAAQRELKLLVSYEDITEFLDAPTNTITNSGFGKRYSVEFPCGTPGVAGVNDIIQPDDPALAQFVTDFENNFVSPTGGTPEVVAVRLVGRNV